MKNGKAEKAKVEKSIGLGFSEPKEVCEDPKCAWHGKLAVRGRVFRGVVKSSKTHSTVIVEWGYHRLVRKYQRYERRKSRVTAYNPPCMKAKEGDNVVIAECRPLSKTKSFVVVNVERERK
ncbi:MAG: 30S ribosomal protein S17 [Candidatus Aenigmatarchaeota archaeon]|nr:MAG: 30S ribosomal protein S17 [Candidatus Aenigmarchaeota archaeon]